MGPASLAQELPLDPSEQPAAQFRIVRFGRKPATELRSLHDVDQRGPQWTCLCLQRSRAPIDKAGQVARERMTALARGPTSG